MKDQSFWFKYILIFGFSLVCFSLGVAWMASHFYAEQANKRVLDELKTQSEKQRGEVISDVRTLVSNLISLQTKEITEDSLFSMLMIIDPVHQKILDIRPKAYLKKMENVKFPKMQDFPVAFYPLKLSWKKQKHIALLVDVDQISTSVLPSHLSKGKILLGVLTSNGLLRLSRFLRNSGAKEAFILDRKKNWFQLHSNVQYSGHLAPKNILLLREKHPKTWQIFLESENILSSGTRLGISDSYLVLNKKAVIWNQYFLHALESMTPVILGIGIVFFILFYFFVHPLLEAYRYLARLLNRYAMCNIFPVPEYVNYNPYINEIQPNLKKLFWKLREEKLFNTREFSKEYQYFSEVIKELSKKIQYKYPQIEIDIQSQGRDIRLFDPSFKQALFEILKNSVESMNSKGLIEVCTFEENGMFCCEIKDQGPGIPPSLRDQICNAYFTSKPKAMGLGLTLAQSALSKMGAVLHFSNAENQGLIVRISLPLDEEQTQHSSFQVTKFR